jgi:hypothetical protein
MALMAVQMLAGGNRSHELRAYIHLVRNRSHELRAYIHLVRNRSHELGAYIHSVSLVDDLDANTLRVTRLPSLRDS